MSVTIELSDPVGMALHDEASRRGVPAQELAETLLSESLPVKRKGSLSALIQSWIDEGDEEEQRETWEALKKGIDENRVGQRKFFPE
jgi:hypothetical protein